MAQPVLYQQAFGNPDYPACLHTAAHGPLHSGLVETVPELHTQYRSVWEIDSQFNPLNTYLGDVTAHFLRVGSVQGSQDGGARRFLGIFYGPVDAQINQVGLSLGVLNKNHTTVENQKNKSQVPDQVNNLINTCGLGFPRLSDFSAQRSGRHQSLHPLHIHLRGYDRIECAAADR